MGSKEIWTGLSGGFLIQWTTEDIQAHPINNTKDIRFSVKALTQKDHEQTQDSESQASDMKNRLAVYERDFAILSVVGSLVSFQDHSFVSFEREAHPAGETRIAVSDLAKPGATVKLTDFFSESDVLRALLRDPLVREALQNVNSANPPKTLNELIARLSSHAVSSEKYCYSISDDLVSRFAFHHVEGQQVAVRIGLSGAGPCRESLTQLGLLLPIPDALKDALTRAACENEGFLMQDVRRIAHQRKTTFKFAAEKAYKK